MYINVMISTKISDNTFLLTSGEVVKVVNIVNATNILCKLFVSKKSAKGYYFDSADLSIFVLDITKIGPIKMVSINEIVTKCVVLPLSVDNSIKCMCIPMVNMNLH